MYAHVFFSFLLIKFACALVDGEFWWLNDKFADYIGSKPPPPKFEDISEFDNDENAKIVFRDENLLPNNLTPTENTSLANFNEKEAKTKPTNHTLIKWTSEDNVSNNHKINHPEDKISSTEISDRFTFIFPKNENFFTWKDPVITTTENLPTSETQSNHKLTTTANTVLYNDKISFIYYKEKLTENICTYVKKNDCYQRKGVLNVNMKNKKKENMNGELVCCILPLKTTTENIPHKIFFPKDSTNIKRLKRSDFAQRQRYAILQQKNSRHRNKAKPDSQTGDYEYEYDDPYLNIKNHKTPIKQKQESNIKYDYQAEEDYIDDYVPEVPKPGLIGLYSDVYNKDTDYGGTIDYEEDDDGFGYSTIDPRIDRNPNRKSKPRGKPSKLATDETYDIESHTISYQANPDFNVLQNFKLPNVLRKKKNKISRSTTTESFSDSDSKESVIENFDKSTEIIGDDFKDHQIFKNCGKTTKAVIMKEKDKQIGDTENGSHPWLAVLVSTHKLNNLLCYASLIHTNAAITAGDCVYRSTPGEITLMAGLWDLNERSRSKSRVITPLMHPKYKTGQLINNMAILHWKRPLKLGTNVQPICLANPHLHHECMFVGWGGFDQAIRPRSRWQRTSVHTCKDHVSLVGINIPKEAFCASVKARSTVTGLGGSLICRINGHLSAVGVAVSRESTLVLLPVFDWVTSVQPSTYLSDQQD